MMPVPRCEDLTAGSRAETDIEGRIIALEALTTANLQIEWRRLYRTMPPTRLSRDLVAGPRYKTLNTAGNTRDALASPTQHRVLQRNIWP